MTDKPQRPVQSSSDALTEGADEASAALAEVNDDLRTSMERIAHLTGTAGSSIGMRNLATELQEIGTAMARALGNTEEQVTETFAAEANTLQTLLRDAHKPTQGLHEGAVKTGETQQPADTDLPARPSSNDGDHNVTQETEPALDQEFGLADTNQTDADVNVTGEGAWVEGQPDSADLMFGTSDVAEDASVESTMDDGAAGNTASSDNASRSQRAAELRHMFLVHADEVDGAFDMVGGASPPRESPQPPPGTEVDDPASAVTLVTMMIWELLSQRHKRRKER